jgi:mono/diheme cytochrome c family protein
MKSGLKNPPLRHAAFVLLLVAVLPSRAAAEGNGTGAGVYKAKCVTCHGQDGSGTPVGKSLQVADLRSPEVQKKSDAELTVAVSEGKGLQGQHHGRRNPCRRDVCSHPVEGRCCTKEKIGQLI